MLIYFLLVLFLFLAIMVGIIFLISFLAANSRKKKQQILMQNISDIEYSAMVRYNRGNQQDKFLKVKAFQGSGVLYVKGDKIYFEDTLHRDPCTFDLKTANIQWVDVNLVNGLLKWFSIADNAELYFFNIDSGMFIFNTDKSKPTTMTVFNNLKNLQREIS